MFIVSTIEAFLSDWVGKTGYSPPADIYVGLSSTYPGQNGATITELNAAGYARQMINIPSEMTDVSGGITQNTLLISFGPATAAWNKVRDLTFHDAATAGTYLGHTRLFESPVLAIFDPTNNRMYCPEAHGFSNGNVVILEGDGIPGTFSQNTDYYIVEATTYSFKLATTSGGTAITFSNPGGGFVGISRAQEVTLNSSLEIPVNGLSLSRYAAI